MKIWKKSLKIASSLIFLKILALRALARTARAAASDVGLIILCSSIGLAGFLACWRAMLMWIKVLDSLMFKEGNPSDVFLAGIYLLTAMAMLLFMRLFMSGVCWLSVKISDACPGIMGPVISKLELAEGMERAIAEARILEEGAHPARGEKIRAKRL